MKSGVQKENVGLKGREKTEERQVEDEGVKFSLLKDSPLKRL